jgi:hypothetical protein
MTPVSELTGRNAFRLALFHPIDARAVVQIAETLVPVFDAPDAAVRP